jgi:gas vesicle protein GvpA/GvpJ/GvpM family
LSKAPHRHAMEPEERALPATGGGRRAGASGDAMEIVEHADQSLLEIIDHVLNKGVLVNGEVFLGVAGVDLVYLRVSALLCAADRVRPAKGRK